jgi:hypothetical protein
MSHVFLLLWIKLLVIIIIRPNLSCSGIFWKFYWNNDIDYVFGTLKPTPWPQTCVGLYSINILYLQSTNSMKNMKRLRRTVNSKQYLTVPQLAGRQTLGAEVRFQSHDRLPGIYGRQGGIGAVFPPSVLVFPCQLPTHQRHTLSSSVADTEDPAELASDT